MNVWNILSLLISALANFEPEEKKNAKDTQAIAKVYLTGPQYE